MIIPEPPGLELPGLPDFLPPRSVETEARVVQRGVIANAGSLLRPRHTEMKDMRLFEDIVSEEVSDKFSGPGRACLFQLERKVGERESHPLRSGSFLAIRLQESESHTEEIINRFRTVHRNTSKPGGVKTRCWNS